MAVVDAGVVGIAHGAHHVVGILKKGVGSVGIGDFGQQVGFGIALAGIAGAVGVIIAVSGSAAGRVIDGSQAFHVAVILIVQANRSRRGADGGGVIIHVGNGGVANPDAVSIGILDAAQIAPIVKVHNSSVFRGQAPVVIVHAAVRKAVGQAQSVFILVIGHDVMFRAVPVNIDPRELGIGIGIQVGRQPLHEIQVPAKPHPSGIQTGAAAGGMVGSAVGIVNVA